MFRCQFSGEVSDGPLYQNVTITEKTSDGSETKQKQNMLVKAAERPVKVAIETRSITYKNYTYDEDGNRVQLPDTYGTEVVKEITIRAKHLEAVKKKYNLA